MAYYGKIVTVSYTNLTRSDDGEAVMSVECYRKLTQRNHATVIVRGGRGHGAEIEYASLPDRYKERYIAKYGDPEEAELRRKMMLTYDNEARKFYADFTLPDGSALKQAQQDEYMLNASVLQKLLMLKVEQENGRKRGGNHTPIARGNIYEISESLRSSSGHTLPKTEKALFEKMAKFEKEGYVCLVSGKLGNANTTKITPEAGEWILAHKMSLNPIYNIQQLFDKFNAVAAEKGWKPIKSVQTLNNFLQRPEIKRRWYGVEQGSQRANNMFVRQNRTELPACRDALWYVDGTKANLYYKVYDAASKGVKAATTNCIHVLDAYSEVFVGFHICEHETFLTTYEAIRNAAETTGTLPYELVSDNQSGFTSNQAKRWQSKLGTICHTTTPYNGKSKTIEHAFSDFQSQFLHQKLNYTGGNITARSEKSRINEMMIIKNKEALPTYAEFCRMYAECITAWNNAPHPKFKGKSRWQVYMDSVNPHAIVLEGAVREDLFYISTDRPSTFTARGIEITIGGQKYAYEPKTPDGQPDLVWRRDNTGREFVVEYDPHDMSRVRLCENDKKYGLRFNTWASTYGAVHRAIQDQEEGERSMIVRQMMASKKEIVRLDIENRTLQMKYGVGAETLGYNMPLPQGVSEKEYLRFAAEIEAERSPLVEAPVEISDVEEETNMGQLQKKQSNFDRIAALDRL